MAGSLNLRFTLVLLFGKMKMNYFEVIFVFLLQKFIELERHLFHRISLLIRYVHLVKTKRALIRLTNSSIDFSAQLVTPGQNSLVYKYETEVKLSVANSAFDLKNKIKAQVNIKNLGSCNYAVQVERKLICEMYFYRRFLKLQNVKITETNDEDENEVKSTANAQKELENLVVRFRWIDGFVIGVDADESAKVDHVNFVKGILSALQVYSPVSTDDETLVNIQMEVI